VLLCFQISTMTSLTSLFKSLAFLQKKASFKLLANSKTESQAESTPTAIGPDSFKATPFYNENQIETYNALVKVVNSSKFVASYTFPADTTVNTLSLTDFSSTNLGFTMLNKYSYNFNVVNQLGRLKMTLKLPSHGLINATTNAKIAGWVLVGLFFDSNLVATYTYYEDALLKGAYVIRPMYISATVFNIFPRFHSISVGVKSIMLSFVGTNTQSPQPLIESTRQSTASLILEGEILQ